MKVTNEQAVSQGTGQPALEKDMSHVRRFSELSQGDRFKASILDIEPGRLTLSLASGDTLTARTLAPPDARIGDESVFLVKENMKGQILLEMVKPGERAAQDNIIREALGRAGVGVTEDVTGLARAMMENGLPLDGQTLQKALFFRFTSPEMTMDKVLFLLKEDFPMLENSVTVLNRLTSGEAGLAAALSRAEEAVEKMPEGPWKQQLADLLSKPAPPEVFGPAPKGTPARKLFFPLDEGGAGQFKAYYRELMETASELTEKLRQMPQTPENREIVEHVTRQMEQVRENVLFMNHIQHYKQYMQIPFSLDGLRNQGELFVFKNGKGRGRADGTASVLIALDTARLGRVETFLTKQGRTVGFQMKCENQQISRFIQQNSGKLTEALRAKGYVVSGFSVKVMSEPFTVAGDLGGADETARPQKRYSFDMRV